jgi:hypothetical protein
MSKRSLLLFMVVVLLAGACMKKPVQLEDLKSPDGQLSLDFKIVGNEAPTYALSYEGKSVIQESELGFLIKGQQELAGNIDIVSVDKEVVKENWEMPWGEKREVSNEYNQLKIGLKERKSPGRSLFIVFRLFDDGLAFRYEFPEQDSLNEVLILEENTEFNLSGDHKCFWIPGDWDIYEHLYKTSRISEIDAVQWRNHNSLAQTHIPNNAVNTPVTLITDDGLHLSFHEANLSNYSGMTLLVDTANFAFKSCLVGSDNHDYKVAVHTPFVTPWRTIQVSDDAAGLIESDMIVNLNEPSVIKDMSWFEPMKYVGIWWDMHLGTKSWDMASGNHGATTEYAKELIDFAAAHNIKGLLVEGWNTGWEHWIGFEDREGVFDFVTPYPDYDLEEVARYAREKGVEIIMHHETSAATETYTKQMDTAFKLMKSLGINAVKTGYVGKILPKGEYHHGQYMVDHYESVLKNAAKYNIAINAHEPIKATGKRRTYPNAIAREGLRGQEFNAWSQDGGNPPEHLPIIAFTRMLAGPIDFTPGIFNIKLDPYKANNQVNTTLAHQLALYVVINSPVQMAADLIKYYEGHPAFQFIEDVAVNWEQSKVLNGEVGDYVTIARQERGGENWFVGGITDENERELDINFDFLPEGKTYKATLYCDAANAHWDRNPQAYEIKDFEIASDSLLSVHLAPGGGFALSLIQK